MASLRDLLAAQGKALGPHPAFEDPGGPVGVVDLSLGKLAGQSPNRGLSSGRGPRVKDKAAGRYLESYGGDQAIDWVFDCIRYWADTVATAEYHFEPEPTGSDAGKIPKDPIAPPQALRQLLEQPNPYMDYIEQMELLVMDLLLTGNAYWFKWRTNDKGQPLALYRLAPPYVEPTTKKWGIDNYIYQIPNADKLEIDTNEVIHFKLANPDPKNPFFGRGIIAGGGRAADLELSLTDTQASYYENHAMPSVTVETDRRVSKDVFRKLKAQLVSRASGSRNAGNLLVLEAGLKMNSIAPSATDAAFEAIARMSRGRVFSWFKMFPILVGMEEISTTTTVVEAQRHFDTKAARPFMNKLQQKVSKELVRAWNMDYVLDYEYQLSPKEQAELGGMYSKLPGIKVKEIRKLSGLEPLPKEDEDVGEMILNVPGEEGGEGGPGGTPTENGFPDPGVANEAGRPPKGENTKSFPTSGNLPKGARAIKSKVKSQGKSIDEIIEIMNDLPEFKAQTDPGAPEEDLLLGTRTAEVDDVSEKLTEALSEAAQSLQTELVRDLSEGKAFDSSDIVSKLRGSKAWKAFQTKAQAAYEDALNRVVSAAVIHHSSNVQPKDEMDYAKIVKGIVKNKDAGIAAITQTFKDRLAGAVKAARTPDATPQQIEAALTAAIHDWQTNQAPTVALTTATYGYNESTLDLAESAGHTHVLVSDGVDTDSPCVDANGETWPLAKARENILEHPNCRRAFVPMVT